MKQITNITKEYKPAFESRETRELVIIVFSTTEEWELEAINQAKAELKRRNVSAQEQEKIYEEILDDWEVDWALKFELRKAEDYSLLEMFLIILRWPVELLNDWDLKAQGYEFKARKRKRLIFSGFLLYVVFFGIFILQARKNEQKRLQEIKNYNVNEREAIYFQPVK